jgi:hypothetical protein
MWMWNVDANVWGAVVVIELAALVSIWLLSRGGGE